jgi:hypothetical protein
MVQKIEAITIEYDMWVDIEGFSEFLEFVCLHPFVHALKRVATGGLVRFDGHVAVLEQVGETRWKDELHFCLNLK